MKWKKANSLNSEIYPALFYRKEMTRWRRSSEKDRNLQTQNMSELIHYPSGYSSIFGDLEPQKKIVAPIVLPYFLVFFNVTSILFYFFPKKECKYEWICLGLFKNLQNNGKRMYELPRDAYISSNHADCVTQVLWLFCWTKHE